MDGRRRGRNEEESRLFFVANMRMRFSKTLTFFCLLVRLLFVDDTVLHYNTKPPCLSSSCNHILHRHLTYILANLFCQNPYLPPSPPPAIGHAHTHAYTHTYTYVRTDSTMSHKGTQVYAAPDLFANDMRKVINETEHSDICFVVGEDREKIHAHKIILAARCEVFRAMFAEQAKSPAKAGGRGGKDTAMLLVLPDVRPTVFLTVLEHIYTNSCRLSQSIVVDVLASAIEYGLEGLVRCCVEYISDPNVDTVCEAIQAAITYKQNDLRDTCMTFIEENTDAIFKSPHFAELSEDSLAYIIQSDNLQADEADIYEAVKEWGTVNMVITESSLKECLKKVVGHVRFPMLSKEMLTQLEQENEQEAVIPVGLISKAWRYHATKEADPSDPLYRRRAGAA